MYEDLELPEEMGDLSDMHQRVTFMIFGSIITVTRAFLGVGIKIYPTNQIIIAKIKLRPVFGRKIFRVLRTIWLARAEDASKLYTPTGWRLIIFYDR